MALVRNGRSIFQNPGKFSGSIAGDAGNFIKGGLRNRNVGGFPQIFSGYSNGDLAPGSFILPNKSGSIASRTNAVASISSFVILTPALPISVNGVLTLTVTNADLDQIIALAASGSASIVVSNALLSAATSLEASASGQITVTSAQLGGIFDILASGTMIIVSDTDLSALAFMEAEAGGPTPLSPEGLANAVWSAPAVDNNSPGTMGEKLNDASAAGNPWSADLASNNTDGTFGAFVQKLLTVAKFLGLK